MTNARFGAALAVAVLGVGLGLFMRWEHARHEATGAASSCRISEQWDCDRVQGSDYGAVAGVSLSLWGAVAMGLVVVWLVAWRRIGEPTLLTLAGLVAALSVPVAVAMFLVSGFVLEAYCLYCTVLQVCFLVLAALVVPPALRARAFRRQPALFAVLAAAAAVVLAGAGEAYAARRTELARLDHAPLGGGARIDLADALILGDPESEHSVLVFFDFGCPHCRRCYGKAKELLAHHPGRVHFIFKHYPLDRACNKEGADQTLHPGACDAARAGQAAALVGETGRAMEFIFRQAERGNPFSGLVFDELGRVLGRDKRAWRALQASAEVEALLRRDLEEGNAMELPKVPILYLNGRHIDETHLIATVDRLAGQ